MKLGIRGKLFLTSLTLIGLMAVTSGILVETVMRRLLVDQGEEELERFAAICRQVLERVPTATTPAVLRDLVRELGNAAGARVTVLAENGEPLADSQFEVARLESADEQLAQPEMKEARRAGKGVSLRYGPLFGGPAMYVAIPFERGDGTGIVRVSSALEEVDALIAQMRWLITAAVMFGLAVAAGMGVLASHIASRSLMELVGKARALAADGRGERISIDVEDELSGLAGSFNRIADELERALKQLHDERNRIGAILQSLTDAVFALDEAMNITDVNDAALRLLELERTPQGMALIDVIRVPALLDVAAKAQEGVTAHTEVIWPGPPRKNLLATAAPQHRPGQCVLVLRDVTQLRVLESMRRDFVANVSHELRTPVSIISANVETLAAGALAEPAKAREFLGAVQRNAERLSRLVNDLLDLSRIEAGHYEIDLRPLSAEGPLGAVIDLLEARANDRGLSLHVEAEDDLRFIGDERSLEHVLVNLVDNAIKYTPSGGTVGIEIKQDRGAVLFEVWDTGPGVPASHRARLFERFYRVDPGRSRDMGGTGLGLSIVKHLVDSMHGTVGMRPRAGGGSVFWVRLPCYHEENDAAAEL